MKDIFLSSPDWVDALANGVIGTFLLSCWGIVILTCALGLGKYGIYVYETLKRDFRRVRGLA